MKFSKHPVLTLISLAIPLLCVAQYEEMSVLEKDGKFYVVVIVLGIILAGLFGYLYYLDRKISKKESGKEP